MTDIEILKKAISKKHPCDECHEALKRIEEEITKLKILIEEQQLELFGYLVHKK